MAWGWQRQVLLLRLLGDSSTIWHNGMTGGFASFIRYDTKKKSGFFFVYNKSIKPDFLAYLPFWYRKKI